ncbi:MAG TPA: hypothetical protein VN193_13900 [Candidatus Angelobacter sp.]|jgi:hypothetical protein|nr:hypothetical protein [Candidatus Angelobacter sp.]
MTSRFALLARRALLPALGLFVVACGDAAVTVPQAAATPLLAAEISVKQTGDAPVKMDQSSLRWQVDDARLVNVSLTVHSMAGAAVTMSGRATLYDKDGKPVGDVSGGALNVAAGADVQLKMTGPTPNGTVTSATFEFTTVPSATPLSG